MRNPNLRPRLEEITKAIEKESKRAIEHNHQDPQQSLECHIDSFTLELLYISLGEVITLLKKIESDESFNRALTALEFDYKPIHW